MDIDLSEYTAGGYFITKYVDRAAYMKADLLPEKLVSISSCINPTRVYVYWLWDLENYQQEVLDFGIPAEVLPDLAEWSNKQNEETFGYPEVFYGLDTAQQFIRRFLPNRGDLLLIGIALPNFLVDNFLSDHKQRVYAANQQVYEEALYGVNFVLSQHKSLPSDGKILGFEVNSYRYNLEHSWWLMFRTSDDERERR